MLKKIARVLFLSVVICIVISIGYIGYYYMEGYIAARSALSVVTDIVAKENCLAKEQVYTDSNGRSYSMQDIVKKELDEYSNNCWFLQIDTANIGAGSYLGSSTGPLAVTYNKNGSKVCANSYETASPRGEVIEVSLTVNLYLILRAVPDHSVFINEKTGASDQGFVFKYPITVKTYVAGLRYYKGAGNIPGFY